MSTQLNNTKKQFVRERVLKQTVSTTVRVWLESPSEHRGMMTEISEPEFQLSMILHPDPVINFYEKAVHRWEKLCKKKPSDGALKWRHQKAMYALKYAS